MNVWYKPRLQSVDNVIQTKILGGEVSEKQMYAVLTALNGAERRGGTVWRGYPLFVRGSAFLAR